VLPNTTFSQNNGVIALTRCANKRAGYMCCFFLVVFGIIAKIAAIIASIPECVLGGMTSFLFVNIVVSGAKILGPELEVRRNRFITAASLSVALGVALVPHWANNDLVRPAAGTANKMLGDTAVIILTTPYCIGTLLAMFLNTIIPMDEDEEPEGQALLISEEPVKQAPEQPQQQAAAAAAPQMFIAPAAAGAPATDLVYQPNYAQQYAAPVATMPQPAPVPMQSMPPGSAAEYYQPAMPAQYPAQPNMASHPSIRAVEQQHLVSHNPQPAFSPQSGFA